VVTVKLKQAEPHAPYCAVAVRVQVWHVSNQHVKRKIVRGFTVNINTERRVDFLPQTYFETERFIVRQWDIADVDALYSIMSNSKSTYWFYWP
jgi:hypothetical protein